MLGFFRKKPPPDPDWSSRQAVGQWGEELAAQYLKKRGYQILARHFTHRIGELDLVARKNGRIIFVEVKTRTSSKFGAPEEAIGWTKQEHLRRMTNLYMLKHKLYNVPYQIDSIAVLRDCRRKATTVRHLENVVTAN